MLRNAHSKYYNGRGSSGHGFNCTLLERYQSARPLSCSFAGSHQCLCDPCMLDEKQNIQNEKGELADRDNTVQAWIFAPFAQNDKHREDKQHSHNAIAVLSNATIGNYIPNIQENQKLSRLTGAMCRSAINVTKRITRRLSTKIHVASSHAVFLESICVHFS